MTDAPPVTVLIADDHPIFLKGLRVVLEKTPGVEIVGEARDGVSAWRGIQESEPAVAILDFEIPELDGIQILRRVTRHQLPVRVVLLTMFKDEELVREAIGLGALGYILKDDAFWDLEKCLKTVMSGKHFIAPELASYLIPKESERLPAGAPSIKRLTKTQLDILRLISRGLQSKEIAEELGVSRRTIENHRYRISDRLGLKGNNSLLRFVMEHKDHLP